MTNIDSKSLMIETKNGSVLPYKSQANMYVNIFWEYLLKQHYNQREIEGRTSKAGQKGLPTLRNDARILEINGLKWNFYNKTSRNC